MCMLPASPTQNGDADGQRSTDWVAPSARLWDTQHFCSSTTDCVGFRGPCAQPANGTLRVAWPAGRFYPGEERGQVEPLTPVGSEENRVAPHRQARLIYSKQAAHRSSVLLGGTKIHTDSSGFHRAGFASPSSDARRSFSKRTGH